MSRYKTKNKPLSVGACAVMEYDHSLERQFNLISRYEDPFKMYRVIGEDKAKRIWLPRNCVNISAEANRMAKGIPVKFTSSFKARTPEQGRVAMETGELLEKEQSFVVSAPTGFGKSVIGCQAIADYGRKTIVVVTKEDLRDGWIEHFKSVLGLKSKEIGLIQGDICDTKGKKVIVGMIQSLSKFGKYPSNVFSDIGLAIFDEVHLVAADVFSNVCFQIPAKVRIGYSATPERKDGKSVVIEAHIGQVKVITEQYSLIPKILVKFSGFKVPQTKQKNKTTGMWELRDLPHKAGRIQSLNNYIIKDADRNKDIVRFLVKAYNKNRNILLLSDIKKHLYLLRELCVTAGIPEDDTALYIGGLSKDERDQAKIKPVMLATYQYTSTGTNIPWLDTMVMATPRSDVIQIIGRILREYEDKKQPVVYDIVDRDSNVLKGYYNSRRVWYKERKCKIVRMK